MPYDINATLERLEQNLKDLDSARKQVENTVNASNELRQTVSDYVESITKATETVARRLVGPSSKCFHDTESIL